MNSKIKLSILTSICCFSASMSWAIVWGIPDTNNLYPNVGSIRGVTAANIANGSCTGSLVARDNSKFVILTASHCAAFWVDRLNSGAIQTVGISFDQNNVINGNFNNTTYFVRGGVPITHPVYDKENKNGSPGPGLNSNDVALVVFPIDAQDSNGGTLNSRWPGLTPITLPPFQGYMRTVVNSYANPTQDLVTISVGYGTGERFPIPSKETGPATPSTANRDTFQIRYIADHSSFLNLDDNNSTMTFSENPARGDNGTCGGDSGSPKFYQDSNFGLIQFLVLSGGDSVCRAMEYGAVVDSPLNANFIACAFVPGNVDAVKACVNALPTK